MNVDRPAPNAARSGRSRASQNGVSRRHALTLAAAGLAAPLLPAVAFAETRKETNPMSYIKVGQENSQPIEIYYEESGTGESEMLPPVQSEAPPMAPPQSIRSQVQATTTRENHHVR